MTEPPLPSADPQERLKLIVLFLVGLVYSISIAWFFATLPNQRYTDDFFPRWYASEKLLTTGRSLYDDHNATELVDIVGWPIASQLGYYYPAYLLLFTAPLALIPYELARFLWTFLGMWSVWGSILLMARSLTPQLSVNRVTVLLILTTISVPMLQHTLNAQFNAVGTLALALTYVALYRKRYLWAGFWAGGLLFKPQTALLPLLVFLLWTAARRERWSFWLGLGTVSLAWWGVAEIFEPAWVVHFWQSLDQYTPVQSVLDRLWNPYQGVSLILGGMTLWFVFRLRAAAASDTGFVGLLVWALALNSLVVPLFGMLHMVIIGLLWAALLRGYARFNPRFLSGVWWGGLAALVAGILAFVLPLVFTGVSGRQITLSEFVYKITIPLLASAAASPLLWTAIRSGEKT